MRRRRHERALPARQPPQSPARSVSTALPIRRAGADAEASEMPAAQRGRRRPHQRAPAAPVSERPLAGAATLSYTLARGARALRLPLLPGTGARPARGPLASAPLSSGAGALEARARGTLVHRLLEDARLRTAQRALAPTTWRAPRRELGMRMCAAEREEIARADRRGRGVAAGRARGCGRERPARAPLRVRARRPRAARHRRHRPARARARRRRAGARLQERPGRPRGATWRSSSSATTALQRLLYALAVLRDGRAKRRGRALVSGASRRSGSRAAYGASERPGWKSAAGGAHRARAGARLRVSAVPHRGLCAGCPGRSALCSWGRRLATTRAGRAARGLSRGGAARPGRVRFSGVFAATLLAPPQVPACRRIGGHAARRTAANPSRDAPPQGALP